MNYKTNCFQEFSLSTHRLSAFFEMSNVVTFHDLIAGSGTSSENRTLKPANLEKICTGVAKSFGQSLNWYSLPLETKTAITLDQSDLDSARALS